MDPSLSSSLQLDALTLPTKDKETVAKVMRQFVHGELQGLGMDFKVWEWSTPQLYGLVLGMFVKTGVVTDPQTLSSLLLFIIDVANGYKDNPYHSFLHAVDVTYIVHWILDDLGLREELAFTTIEIVALLVAALTHDVLHPGMNNLFHVNARTEIAHKYNFKSVLEMQSCDYVQQLFRKHSFLHSLSYGNSVADVEDPIALIESIVVEAILHTDMCHHFQLLERLGCTTEAVMGSASVSDEDLLSDDEDVLDERLEDAIATMQGESGQILEEGVTAERILSPDSVENVRDTPISPQDTDMPGVDRITSSTEGFSRSSEQERRTSLPLTDNQRQQMINVLLHAADISNAARPYDICKRWADMVVQEFFLQGEQEKRLSLPVSPNMDRETTNPVQIGFDFSEYVARPYFEVLGELFPSTHAFVDNLIANKQQWVDRGASVTPAQPPAKSNEQTVPRGRRLSLAAGTIEIPQAFDKYVLNAAKRYRHRFKTSRSLSSGRSRGIYPLASASNSAWSFERDGQDSSSFDSDSGIAEELATLSIFGSKRLFPITRRCMSMDAQAMGVGGAIFQKWKPPATEEESSQTSIL